ncbi:MAG: SLBB domain-containing protein [Chitinispirillia bacterium]|nr:SLBB domain-containing protein [Chitinispirillia bacterium]MCL2241164.1 SLBB domain-containing protein [Chitinispirillia bacterium]
MPTLPKHRHLTLILISLTALLAVSVSPRAQNVVSPELMRQLRNDRAASEQIQRYLQKNPGLRDSVLQRSMAAQADSLLASLDSAALSDSLLLAADTARRPFSGSVYEDMFSGKVIYPDSIIPYLQPFGYEVFSQRREHVFGPGEMGGVPADYPIRPGDELKITLWGRINDEYNLHVSREGTVSIPHNVGPVTVAGLSFSAAQKAIAARLKNIEGVNVSVSVGEIRPIGIYVVGEVNSPGFHTVSPLTSVTNALFAANGITKRGSLRNVQLRRNGRLVADVDFYEFLISGNDRSGLRLHTGDVITVPVARQVAAVAGNVRRSALYELKQPTKLADILDLAGGVSPAGWTGRIQVERFQENSHHIVLDADSPATAPDFMVKDGDLIKIFPVISKDQSAIYLSGNVMRPGKYEFRAGMRVRDVIGSHRDIMPETYFDYAVILRKTYPSYLDRIVSFNLGKALEDAASDDNVPLEDQDRLIIYNSDYFNPDRSVSIEGAVTAPGIYKMLDNMTVRDLILQAGGLSDEASKERGELYRRSAEGESVVTRKIEFSIDRAMNGNPEQNVVLQRNDKIFIRSMMGWESERNVRLGGQIQYPGTYVVFENETLGDLITRAGGFKPDAYLPAAVFTRQSVKEMEESRMKLYNNELGTDMLRLSIEMASKGVNVSSLLEQQMMLKGVLDSVVVLGRVMIDMTKEEHYKSFVLEDSDELYVPRNLETVSVLGEVYSPGTFRLDAGNQTVVHYLDIAGGPKETANKKAIYVIKANGSVISNKAARNSSVKLEPGDVVIVPAKIRYSNNFKIFIDSADATLKIGSFITAVITLVLTINNLNKP